MSRTVIFYDPTFPYEGIRPDEQAIAQLQEIGQFAPANELEEALQGADHFIHLHGRYFPKTAWQAILAYARKGKGFVHLGSAPFRVPAYLGSEGWELEIEQTTYHQQLQIHEILPVDASPITRYAAHQELPLLAGKENLFAIQPTVGFALHVTRTDDHPGQIGSSGPMDAHFTPLLKGISREGREVAAPIVLLENTKGAFAGSRWIFANVVTDESFWSNGGAALLADLAAYTKRGVTEIWFKPNYACYDPGDRASLTVQLQTIINRRETSSENETWTFHIEVFKDGIVTPCGRRISR